MYVSVDLLLALQFIQSIMMIMFLFIQLLDSILDIVEERVIVKKKVIV